MMVGGWQLPTPAPPPGPSGMGHMTVGGTLGDVAAVFIVIAVMGTAVLLLWPLIRAIARRLEGRAASPELEQEVAALRSRLDQVEQGQARIAELEERVDFAERLLSQPRESDRLQR